MRRPALAIVLPLSLLLAAAPFVAADHTGPVEWDPAALAGLFPTHEELDSLIARAAAHPWVERVELGESGKGRGLVVLEITDRESALPMDARVVTLLITQQHGNEPAGTGAAAQLLEDFLAGNALQDGVLENQVLLLLAMANPDGATANARANAAGVDINRDHVHLESSEAQSIHAVLNRWDVHVAMDHHEYGGTGFGNPVPVRVYDYDLTTMFPNHGNVRQPTRDASEELMYDVLWPAAQAAGYTANEYGEQTIAGVPVQQLAGGPDPGIMRNNLGLNNVAGLLIETRIDAHPNPFHDAQRRIDIQRLVMEATLAHASEHAERFIDIKRESERLSLDEPASEYVEGDKRGRMPAGFRTAESVDPLMALHGFPPALAHDEVGHLYTLTSERQALLAAILHPQSSRAAVATQPVEELPDASDVSPAAVQESLTIPAAPFVLALVLVALAAVARRGRPGAR